jgi:intein/homing endonuclease
VYIRIGLDLVYFVVKYEGRVIETRIRGRDWSEATPNHPFFMIFLSFCYQFDTNLMSS